MKKITSLIVALLLALSLSMLVSCNSCEDDNHDDTQYPWLDDDFGGIELPIIPMN